MNLKNPAYQSCIESCQACAAACYACASQCLEEEKVKMLARCIAIDFDCGQLCDVAAALMARDSEFAAAHCGVCAEACDACAAECEKHEHDHCKACAKACRECAEECRKMAS